MATIFGKTIALTTSNLTARDSGWVISVEALLLLAFEAAGNVPEINGANAGATLVIEHASGSTSVVSVASGRDAILGGETPTTPNHSVLKVAAGDPVTTIGPLLRSTVDATQHWIVITNAVPTGTQLQVTAGVG